MKAVGLTRQGNEAIKYITHSKRYRTDYFLYVRCYVVANGKDFYYKVLNNPTEMPKGLVFESLFYLADDAYHKKLNTEEEFIDTKLSFETFSNVEKWK